MALGFFNLGPQTHMSGKLGSQAFGVGPKILVTPPLTNSFCCCYEKE